MKFLNQFTKFDLQGFLADKQLMVTGTSEWVDFDSKAHRGTKIEVAIVSDRTKYKQRDGQQETNRFEKLAIKVSKDVTVPLESIITLVNGTASVYGDYRNQLSVTADDVKIMPRKDS